MSPKDFGNNAFAAQPPKDFGFSGPQDNFAGKHAGGARDFGFRGPPAKSWVAEESPAACNVRSAQDVPETGLGLPTDWHKRIAAGADAGCDCHEEDAPPARPVRARSWREVDNQQFLAPPRYPIASPRRNDASPSFAHATPIGLPPRPGVGYRDRVGEPAGRFDMLLPPPPPYLAVEAAGRTTEFINARSPPNSNWTSFGSFERLIWRGAPGSFVDVFFDLPLDRYGVASSGIPAGTNFIRYYWPPSDTSTRSYEPLSEARRRWPPESYEPPPALGALGDWRWTGVRRPGPTRISALRYYDPGQCSAVISWPILREAFANALSDEFRESIRGGIGPTESWLIYLLIGGLPFVVDQAHGARLVSSRLVPTLRGGYRGGSQTDSFRVEVSFLVQLNPPFQSTVVTVWLDLSFYTDSGRLALRVNDADPALLARREEIETLANRLLYQLLAQVPLDMMGAPAAVCERATPARQGIQDASCLAQFQVAASFPSRLPAGVSPAALLSLRAGNAVCVTNPPNTPPDPMAPGLNLAACGVAPNVPRVFQRPEGVQLVLGERSPADPLEGVLRALTSFCENRYSRYALVGRIPSSVD